MSNISPELIAKPKPPEITVNAGVDLVKLILLKYLYNLDLVA